MFMAMFPELVSGHLKGDTRKQLEKSSDVRRIIFERITIGVNVTSVEVYQNIVTWLLTLPEKRLKEMTIEDVTKGAGEYIDESGRLA